MATRILTPCQSAASKLRPFMPNSAMGRSRKSMCPTASRRQPVSASHRSADLAGRMVALGANVPAIFDQPLALHHKLLGRWVAGREGAQEACTRVEARRRIERAFRAVALDILAPVELADLRIAILSGEENQSPVITITCESIGQIDLGWIETSDAPIGWRAAAYAALERTLSRVLPVFAYQDLFEEISRHYWEGETDDAAALEYMIACHGADLEDLDSLSLPSTMNDRRPDWMIRDKAIPVRSLPARLREIIRRLDHLHRQIDRLDSNDNAWAFHLDIAYEYFPGIEECSPLPPLTLVPVDQFAREVDDVAQHGMEYGFFDLAGICVLQQADKIDRWLSSLQLGVKLLTTAQELILLDPTILGGSHGKS